MRLLNTSKPQALYSVASTRLLEQQAQRDLPFHTLMQRAGLAVAKLALAVAPHAQLIWVACGPGNNGGDGLEAAMHLKRWGKPVVVTWLGVTDLLPADAAISLQNAKNAGVVFADEPPAFFDLVLDALLGIGARECAPKSRMASWIDLINSAGAPVLAVALPTGLQADTGAASPKCIKATHTLSLLTLKPGLFTAQGRDAGGTIWHDDLGTLQTLTNTLALRSPDAWLAGKPEPMKRAHDTHKGTFGDVAVIGAASGMVGAALLSANAALHSGAGRVFVSLLDGGSLTVDTTQPEFMFRPPEALPLEDLTVVCGCGGGTAIAPQLPKLLASSRPMVIDADALNSIASDTALQAMLAARFSRSASTILTPHPLEAARLLGCSSAQVQADRLASAQQIAQRYSCTVVLKGSGTVIAQPGKIPVINPTGNARLATGGTGDVLAGMIGAYVASGLSEFDAAWQAVYQHGTLAEHWPASSTLSASGLARVSGTNHGP